ncbi:MAG TPA: hypothetical protein DEH78_29135 [Solibacterales bacterium]|nr:hypothetical protein [Bryobacterales bacterium]
MRRNPFVAIAAILSLSVVHGQTTVTLDESKIRAVLRGEKTFVAIPFFSTADHPVSAELTTAWVGPEERESSRIRRPITIHPGQSTIETGLPLENSSIWTRLRYTVTPDRANARAFGPVSGVLSLVHISDYAFELRTNYAGVARRGGPMTVHAEAVHPVSRIPVAGIEWKATLSIDRHVIAAKAVSKHHEGFVDFTFDVPPATGEDSDSEATVVISAKRGDFEQNVPFAIQLPDRLSARFQTDKPIYQPGQTMHLRAVVSNAQGQAVPGAKVALRIDDQDNERVHTVQLVASRFGIIQDDWVIPPSAGLGTYQVTLAAQGDDDYDLARHVVRVSRYDLPTFTVTAKPDRSAYVSSEPATVTITGTYLFGKPVSKGRVKIVRSRTARWNPKLRKTESADEVVAAGDAKEDGTFAAQLDLKADHDELKASDTQRFEDLHFAAYFTDTVSGRTEQHRFDVRITREPIHVYLIRTDGGGRLPSPVYVTTSYADGRPASASVSLQFQGKTTTFTTNRYGVGKTALVSREDVDDGPVITVTDGSGNTGQWKERYWQAGAGLVRIQTRQTIHRAGQAVTLQVTSPLDAPPEQAVLIHAISGDRKIATRIVQLTNHLGEITFPYQPEFRRTVVFVAWNAVDPRSDDRSNVLGSRAVIFPDGSDLRLTASPDKLVYKPGEKAALRMRVASQDGRAVEAALGLAVVDQAVLERARTDGDFGRRPWFACAFCRDEGEAEIGGIRLNDLFGLKPQSEVSPELDLVAEALVARAGAFVLSQSSESVVYAPTFASITAQVQQITASLDHHYVSTLEVPEELTTFSRILGRSWADLLDPWGKPYAAEFSVLRDNSVVSILSGGPDKRFGTLDDFVAGTFRRKYFAPVHRLIEQALAKREDYPASDRDFLQMLDSSGLRLDAMLDRWGTPYRARVLTAGVTRLVSVVSAGPDRAFETKDDFALANFAGGYFRREAAQIRQVLQNANPAPQSTEDFQRLLASAGIDVTHFRDAWEKPYRVVSLVSSRYSDRVSSTTSRVFGSPASTKTEITPVTQRFLIISLRSDGPDRIENTYDDFDIARFPILLNEESAELQVGARAPQATALRGTGAISGTVTDQAGAVIPNVTITLVDASQAAYESTTDQEGIFHFVSVPPGLYSLRAAMLGFTNYEVTQVPVAAGRTTNVDVELRVGPVAETVTVEADAATLQTQAASVSAAVATATPRVREYFPETLVWSPEILTSANGESTHEFALADTVTTWKVAVFASTLDGRIADAESEFRTFQPFFLDFSPPSILTEGDQIDLPVTIRNYQDRAQRVALALQPNQWSSVKGDSSRRVTVPSNGSINVSYTVQARNASDRAPHRLVANGARVRDSIEKTSRVRPDGQEVVQTKGDFAVGKAAFTVNIPPAAIPGATRSELRIYPNIASLLLESSSAILTTPLGCAEQTISAGFANLVSWRFAHATGVVDPKTVQRALANVRLAVDGLGAFRSHDGGVKYWARGEPDIAVTAHALSFLLSASTVSSVDRDDLLQIVAWLEKAQSKDGRWAPRSIESDQEGRQSLLLTALVTRALGEAQKAGINVSGSVLGGAYHYISRFTDQTDEPYMLANFVLAALDSGDEALLGNAVARLASMSREERGGIYWDMRTNSPFYGWGTAGRYETTGLVVSALSAWRASHPASTELDPQIRRGLVFLLRGRDATGMWFSTQATLRSMRAIVDASSALGNFGGHGGSLEVRSNGRLAKTIPLPSDPKATDPILLDLSPYMLPGDNEISLAHTSLTGSALVRLSSSHWIPWEQTKPRNSAELRFEVAFDRLSPNVFEPIRCTVKAERVGFKGYGMMLGEIGLPPGAEVDRASLESVVGDGSLGVDHYEVLPDRVVLYLWPKAGGTAFDFYLSARNSMVAKSAPSVLYDYNNPEALSELAPFRWSVK